MGDIKTLHPFSDKKNNVSFLSAPYDAFHHFHNFSRTFSFQKVIRSIFCLVWDHEFNAHVKWVRHQLNLSTFISVAWKRSAVNMEKPNRLISILPTYSRTKYRSYLSVILIDPSTFEQHPCNHAKHAIRGKSVWLLCMMSSVPNIFLRHTWYPSAQFVFVSWLFLVWV